ncbi:T9SS type B sorting domain-containing protein [Chryseobacterium sp.]|uniref:T9SS type B sorting domain-containing protein n=1 Tax=Chryseobacterium sp. TaxID=1871047 RepID=UPI0011CAD2C7|nr:T9SS type B sorting domain-containing protein [Chryseobacterium sp.]TXF77209.1 gliding motility-associated C-terminal domain-containing protein [Chryseobacterium sp.]
MRKILSFFLILLSLSTLFAQLDRQHWFAPMVDRTGNPNQFQSLYLSTNRITPFPVNIYNNNVLIGTVNISKGNPQKFDVLRQYIITTQQADLFTPTTKGLYLEAEFPFYANLRFSVFNHGEIITSKGISSTGTKFYAGMAPITVSNGILNFMTSVLATQDNTTVTISGYSPLVQFSNGTTGTTNPTMTFTLNKGQSYIVDGSGLTNTDGFIGAKIESNKPVNITNGNFNGQYAGNFPTSSDIMMDQSIPVPLLGTNFALVKGNGTIGTNMEGAVVIATENNTQIFVNNEVQPIATINEGKYFVIPDTKYQLQGNNHYNLLIGTSKNAYVYQILAGEPVLGVATGGFNFIPALNCYLPKQIDELGMIDENFVFSNGNPTGILHIPTKLNLITETGAVVTVNGVVPPASSGPFPMTGTLNWVTYGIPNVTGNITVVSDKAITAGITAGSDAVGYGGFFAGFPTTPAIVTSGGTCVPGIVLTVDPIIYNAYQWYINGTLIPGATSASYTPTGPGNYTAAVTMGSCAPLFTAAYKVLNCVKQSASTVDVCVTQTITPAFTTSTQAPVPATVSIVTPPTAGTATVNPTTGIITYTVTNPGTAGTDTFVYTFCGNNPDFPDCETVTVTVNILDLPVTNTTLNACNVNGQGTYNLTTAVVTAQSPVVIKYYPTLADAQTQNAAAEIVIPTAYVSTAGTVVYALVKTPLGCSNIAQITLGYFPLAVVSDYNGVFCDENVDGSITIDLSTITPLVLTNASYFTVKYYATLNDATAGNTSTLPNSWSYTTNTTIYIRVESPDGCSPVIKALNFSFGAKIPLLLSTSSQSVCDDNLDGTRPVDISAYFSNYTNDPAVSATYHATLTSAQNNTGALTNPVTVTGTQTFYIRFEKAGICPNIAPITITVKTPKKSDVLTDQTVCAGNLTTLDAGPGFTAYLWSTGATSSSITGVGTGTYWVDLTFNGCVYRQSVNITNAELPTITAIDIKGTTVTVTATGGTPPYEYSLDGLAWQTTNVFYNVSRGTHTIYVRDAKACSVVKKDFSIINLINTITPNGDGINDVINYSELLMKSEPLFRIFDRYGAEVFRGTASNRFIWDGTISGRPVPTATYWYLLQWKEFGTQTQVNYTSWLLVKNRNDTYFKD